ncbi:MAG: hypothetical protein ACKVG9_05050 [Rhodospirillales bacterium]|jgi:hypothetical protein
MVSYFTSIAASLVIILFSAYSWADGHNKHVVDLVIKSRVVIGDKVIKVTQGQSIVLRWSTDKIITLHIHGYNIKTMATPSKPSSMNFLTRATGRYAVTSHGFGQNAGHRGHGKSALVYVEVHPK